MNSHIKKYLLQSTMMVGALTAGLTTSAFAQDADEDEIVVTGSRIAKKDFESVSPVATIGDIEFEFSGTVNTESLLNTLPQTIPGLDRTSNNPGNGTASVDLRGLGSQRTLVLINGKRMVPTSGGGVVDINNIPTSLIKNVEVLTGGASAVYGSDAVSGVVNFIMKDDFEGFEARAGYEATESGDAEFMTLGATIGANFDNGKGNVVLDVSYTDRGDLFQGDRDFSFFAQFDDGNGGFIDGGSSGIPGTSIFAGGVGPGSTANCDTFGVTFNPDGSFRCFQTTGDDNDFYNYAPVNYIQLPQERFQGSSFASYEVNENIEVYADFLFSMNDVPQQLAPTPIFQTVQFSIDGSPFLNAATQQALSDAFSDGVDTDGDGIADTGTAFIRRRLLEVGPRISDDQFVSFMMRGGVRGELTDGWDYDVSFQEGRVINSSAQRGNVSRTRFQQAMLLADADGDGNADGAICADGSANGATAGCAPINIFGEGNISEAGAAFLRTSVNSDARYNQRVGSATLTGDSEGWLELPGGPIGIAVGGEWREETFEFDPSQDLASGNIAGFNGSPAVPLAGFDVWEVFGELYLPILGDIEFIDNLSLELAYRYSDYSTVGGVDAFKVAGNWDISDNLGFRASYNTAVRAPSITELFAPIAEGFPGATDPCSAASAPVSAAIEAICLATGVPAGNIGSPVLNLPAGQVRALGGGNPNLTEEQADTFSVGVVARPISGLNMSVDYFDITIDEAISAFGGGAANIIQTCYTDTTLGGVGSDFCNAITRRGDGTIQSVLTAAQNVASIGLEGIDGQVDYTFDALGGQLQLGYLGTYTMSSTFEAFDGAPVEECAGEFGLLICGEPVPEYKHRMTARYAQGPWRGSLSWRHIGGVDDDDAGTDYTVERISSANYFEGSVARDIGENFTVLLGVDNIFDKAPPILGDNQEQANTWPATYDVFGRTFFGRVTAKF